jgi:lysylphosphatidylglycerol synthetase-like protein (DUF2156 family)
VWALVFGFTNFVMAVGDPIDDAAANHMTIAFWVEIAVLVGAAVLFYRAEMKDGAP